MVERTFAMIKPNVVQKNLIGEVLAYYERHGLRIAAARLSHLSTAVAEGFYQEHQARPFFKGLIQMITKGPVLLLCLEGENAVLFHRELIGSTDPAQAKEGTLRKLYGESIEANAVHGSDSLQSAAREIGYFFSASEIMPRS